MKSSVFRFKFDFKFHFYKCFYNKNVKLLYSKMQILFLSYYYFANKDNKPALYRTIKKIWKCLKISIHLIVIKAVY